MKRSVTFAGVVHYLSLVVLIPFLQGSTPRLPDRQRPLSWGLALFWCLSVVLLAISGILAWRYGGLWLVGVMGAATAFLIAELLVVFWPHSDMSPPDRHPIE